jgi:hypothetical protein
VNLSISRTSFRAGEAALIWLAFQRSRRRLGQPSAPARIFGLVAAPFSDLSGWPGETASPRLQKALPVQADKRSAPCAGLVCAIGMYRAVFSANENKSGSGETNIMTDLRKRR